MYSNVEVNKNIVLQMSLSGSTYNFSRSIELQFVPDVMVVKLVNYSDDTTDNGSTHYLWSDLVNGHLCSFVENMSSFCPGITYAINKSVKGNFAFQTQKTPDPQTIDTTGDGVLTVHLEFIKYKK